MKRRRCTTGLRRQLGAGAFFYGDGDLLDNFEAEAFQCGNVHGSVGEQADALDAKVGKDLAAEADGAEDAAGAGLRALTGAELLVEDEPVGGLCRNAVRKRGAGRSKGRGNCRCLVDVESARSVVEVEDGATTLLCNHAHGVIEDFAAVAVGGEDVAGGTARVDADKDGVGARGPGGSRVAGYVGGALVAGGAAGAQVAANEGDVAFAAVDLALVGDHAEFAVFGLNAGFAGPDDVALVAEAVANELGNGEDAQTMFGAERNKVGDAGHFAVIAHDFADDAGGLKASEASEIDGGLRLAGADQDASLSGAQGKDVPRADEIVGRGARRDGGADGVGAVGCGDAGGDTLTGFDGFSKGSTEARGVLLGHREEAQVVGAFLSEGEADEAAAVAGHEVDGFRSDVVCGEGQIAFVFAIFIIDDDDHASGADFCDGAGDVSEGRLEGTNAFRHRRQLHSRRLRADQQSRLLTGNKNATRGRRFC